LVAARQRGLKPFTVGRTGKDIQLIHSTIDAFAQRVTLGCAGKRYSLKLPLVGAFQVDNTMVAAGLAIATGSDAANVLPALEKLACDKGRSHLAGSSNGAPIFVDYAHKPDALAKALEALRPYVKARFIVVFGCGGDRDKGKRPLMGAIAADLADRVIVTDDNPRRENTAGIRQQIRVDAHG